MKRTNIIGILILNVSSIFLSISNVHGECEPDTIYQFQFDAGIKYPKLRYILNYDNQKKITQQITQNWDDISKKFISYEKLNNTFNANGKNIETITYVWNQGPSKWDNWSKYTSTYDANLNNTETIYYTWNNSSNAWINNSKTLNTFDAQNNRLSRTTFNWSSTNSSWTNRFQNISTFTNNNVTTRIDYAWDKDNSIWEPYNKITYTYDGNANLDQTISQGWNLGNTQWDNEYRNTFSYNSDNLEILNTEEEWDNGWKISRQSTSTYNPNKDITEESIQVWNPNDLKWENSYKTMYTYNINNYLLAIDYFSSWSISSNDFNFHTRDEYICDGILAINPFRVNQFQIFPNPCLDEIFTINTNMSGAFSITDYSGRVIQTGSLEVGTNKIFHSFPNGLYFIRTINSIERLVILR